MRRVLFRWHGIDVYSYPFMLYVGLVSGVVVGNYAANLAHLDSARVLIAMLLLLVPALAGARLLFVVTHWQIYRREPRRIWRRSEGGAAMYGGLLLMVPLSVPLLGALHVPLGAFWDVATFTILTGMAFTRVGCLLNGCCAGRPTNGWLAMCLPDHRGVWRRRFPTQLLEAGWALVLLAGAAAVWDHTPFPGALFLATVAGYGAARLLLESGRQTENGARAIGLHHALSALFVMISAAVFYAVW